MCRVRHAHSRGSAGGPLQACPLDSVKWCLGHDGNCQRAAKQVNHTTAWILSSAAVSTAFPMVADSRNAASVRIPCLKQNKARNLI